MKKISKVNKIEKIHNDLRHNDEKIKQRKKNSTEFDSILKKEERKLEVIKQQNNLNSLEIYKVEIQKQKPFIHTIKETIEKTEENEHDEK